MILQNFNVTKDTPDNRDYKFSALKAPQAVRIFYPGQVDLRPKMSTVLDQGNLGSCTANAIASAFQYNLVKQRMPSYTPSRLFVYYNERLLEGTVNVDAGAMLRDGIKVINTYGVCPETIWPYQIPKFAVKPSDTAYRIALQDRAVGYYRVDVNETAIKTALASGFPVIAGMAVFDSFLSRAVAKGGMVPMPTRYDQFLGGHAVLIVGFNESTQRFIVRNSWGSGWGDRGHFYLPYAYANTSLMADCWVITKVV